MSLNLQDTTSVVSDLVDRNLVRLAEVKELPRDYAHGYAYLLVDEKIVPKGIWESIPESLLGDPPTNL